VRIGGQRVFEPVEGRKGGERGVAALQLPHSAFWMRK